MFQPGSQALRQFTDKVGIGFQLYNGLFTSLPFHKIENTGVLLAMLLSLCEEGFQKGESPQKIIDDFFARQTTFITDKEKNDLLFRFIQFAERQVVLFDALEDSAFTAVNDMTGPGTLKHLFSNIAAAGKEDELRNKLKDFAVQIVLTAHPTQFYPGSVLGIINDLANAVKENNVDKINMYLQQLGKTAFLKKQKPTPFDEAVSLIWYLENVFYNAAGKIISQFEEFTPPVLSYGNPVLKMGFWPGGDRDGNPFVTAETTLQVAAALRSSILKCYYVEVRKLRRRLTFGGVEEIMISLEKELYDHLFGDAKKEPITVEYLLSTLKEIKKLIQERHSSLFIDLVQELENKVAVFGLHFAALDVRQESSIHGKVLEEISAKQNLLPKNYTDLSNVDKINAFGQINSAANISLYEGMIQDSILTATAIQKIQQENGEAGCNRYIISQCKSALHVMEVYAILLAGGWKKESLTVDIIPLFETIDDLQRAGTVMQELYNIPLYKEHLKQRGNRQTIMLGFSDGTKDGGYLMANWGIYKAKEMLTEVSRDNNIEVVFFDGRGGPPSRGGGKTHRFYSSMGHNIANREIQVTVQGQTVSSSFGTAAAATYNIEQLLSAGISNELFSKKQTTLTDAQEAMLEQLSADSLQKYIDLKMHPDFMQYLLDVSPLQFYSDTNIGSRPAKRGAGKLTLGDLRAIPYVGAWSQIKQNITGYYGTGTALQKLDEEGRFREAIDLYNESMYFKTLMENCEMAMKKTWLPLTAHLADSRVHGEIYNLISEEFERTKKYVLLISGRKELMDNYPVDSLSVQMRERIVLPLSTIQQYAIGRIHDDVTPEEQEVFRKLIIRSSFGIINAARNAV